MPEDALVTIVRGDATPEEVAAVVGVLLTRPPDRPAPAATPPSEWARSARPGRFTTAAHTAVAGPGAWRASALPR